jgi:hypothetical protein
VGPDGGVGPLSFQDVPVAEALQRFLTDPGQGIFKGRQAYRAFQERLRGGDQTATRGE